MTEIDLQQFKDALARECHGETTAEAQAKGLCINCKLPALERCSTDAGRGEYRISGMCEICFDELFADEDEEEAK